MDTTAEGILRGFNHAKSDRIVVENTWEDIEYFVVPRKRGIQSTVEAGEKPPFDVYDDTAIQSNLILAAGLSGYMTNSAQRWFELRTRDEKLMNNKDVRQFFNDSAEIMYATFANSNFYQQIHELYLDLGSLGIGALYSEEDVIEDIRFYARHPKEIYCVENEREVVDMVYRYFKMTAFQAYKFFGKDMCGESIRKAVEESKDYNKPFFFIHYVCPRSVRVAGKSDSKNLPYASLWVSETDKKIVKEGGYEEFPFGIPRFYKNSTETYGYGAAHSCYSDIRMLNKMVEFYYRSGELAAGGPLLMEEDGIIGTLDLRYNAINYQKQPLNQGRAVEPLFPNGIGNPNMTIDFINRVENKIKSAFFVDLFLMLAQNNNMTATEVIERTQEKMIVLGPVLGRLQSELLTPVVLRTFKTLLRRGKLPPAPQALMEVDLDVVYVSPLAKAQRALQAKDLITFVQIIGQMVAVAPTVMDNVNTDKIVNDLGKSYSIDTDVFHDEETVAAIREQRTQAQMAQAQMLNVANAANIAKTASDAQLSTSKAKALRETK